LFIRELEQHIPIAPYKCTVQMEIEWRYPWRKSEPKKNRIKGWKYCGVSPDIDNLMKTFLDCCTEVGFWDSDGRVSDIRMVKAWSDEHGIAVRIRPVG